MTDENELTVTVQLRRLRDRIRYYNDLGWARAFTRDNIQTVVEELLKAAKDDAEAVTAQLAEQAARSEKRSDLLQSLAFTEGELAGLASARRIFHEAKGKLHADE